MFEVSDQQRQGAVIKVIGIGGGGGNAISYMIESDEIKDVEFVAANTDVQALAKSEAETRIQLGPDSTDGLGAGANPDVGRRAAEETKDRLREVIQDADMLFIAAGMGGGTGTGAAPVIAELAKELEILTVAVVTKPFVFEGRKRMAAAETGVAELAKHVDSLITIPNNKLLSVLGQSVSLLSAFRAANGVLQGAVQGIADLITRPGLINVDFADVRTVMSEMGMAMMGTGHAAGEERARVAAEAAISSPLLEDVDMRGARGVLVNITAGADMTIGEFGIVGDTIRGITSEDATVVIGTVIDPEMTEELRVTVVVTGLTGGQYARTNIQERLARSGLGHANAAQTPATSHPKQSHETPQAATPAERLGLAGQGKPAQQAGQPVDDDMVNYLSIPAFLRRDHETIDE